MNEAGAFYIKSIKKAIGLGVPDPADRRRVYEHMRADERRCSQEMHPHVVLDTMSDPSGTGRFLMQALAAVLRESIPQGIAVCDLLHERYTQRDESTGALWLTDEAGHRLAVWKFSPYLCVRCQRVQEEHHEGDGCAGYTSNPRDLMTPEQRYELGLQ